jgi:hypothetical protein
MVVWKDMLAVFRTGTFNVFANARAMPCLPAQHIARRSIPEPWKPTRRCSSCKTQPSSFTRSVGGTALRSSAGVETPQSKQTAC